VKLGLLLLQLLLVGLHLQARKSKLKESGMFPQACPSSCTGTRHRVCHRITICLNCSYAC